MHIDGASIAIIVLIVGCSFLGLKRKISSLLIDVERLNTRDSFFVELLTKRYQYSKGEVERLWAHHRQFRELLPVEVLRDAEVIKPQPILKREPRPVQTEQATTAGAV